MKTTAAPRIRKIGVLLAFAFTVALAAQSIKADTMSLDFVPIVAHTLNLTEVNNTTLLVSYVDEFGNPINGAFSAAQNTGTDSWEITILSSTISFTLPDQSAFWIEPPPESPLSANEVTHSSDFQTTLFVSSEESLFNYVGTSATVPNGTPVIFGTDGTFTFQIRFTDNAAQAESGVPDGGSTLALLAVSVAGLFALRRLGRFQLA